MNFERLDDLLHRFGEDLLEADEQEELARTLEASDAARARAVRHFHAESMLADVLAPAGSRDVSEPSETAALHPVSTAATAESRGERLPSRQIASFLRSGVALALFGLLVAGLAYLCGLHEGERQAGATAVEVVDLDAAEFEPGETLRVGERVGPGEVRLARGRMTLKFDCGATLSLLGPARLAILDDRTTRLDSGRVSVEAPKSAVGFTVSTPTGDYVDLGTEFGVVVGEDGSSEVHVFDGVVIARPRESDLALPVFEREAGRVEPDSGAVVAVDIDEARFARPRATAVERSPEGEKEPIAEGPSIPRLGPDARIVFLGDQHVDKDTHLLLIRQAFAESGMHGPVLFNAAEAFPLAFDEEQYVRYVDVLSPTHAVIQFGPEVTRRPEGVDPVRFREQVARLVERLAQADVKAIIATGYLPGATESQRGSARQIDGVLRALARERRLRLIDVASRFVDSVEELRTPDDKLPSFEGYRAIAQSVLAGIGYSDVSVPERLRPEALPGTVTDWRVLYASDAKEAIENPTLLPEFEQREGWKALRLPQSDSFAMRAPDPYSLVSYRDRARGFATHLGTKETAELLALASIDSDREKEVWIHLGASAKGVVLNGQAVYRADRWTGWHAGRDRLRVRLQQGENRIVLYASGSFFLSVNDELDW